MRSSIEAGLSTLLSYILFETIFYFALCFGLPMPVHPYYNYTAWTNSHFVAADPIIGFRLQPNQPNDGIRVIRGDVQFYYPGLRANHAGFFSAHEYFPRKQKPYRVVVYGSSFVAMLYQTGTWVDHLNDILDKEGVEVYNFSFDAGSSTNWYAHYFRELIPRYDFDMVVFPMVLGDINSRLTIAETRPDGYFINGFNDPPRDSADLNSNYRPALRRVFGLADPTFLARLDEHFRHHQFLMLPVDLYALKSLRLVLFGDQRPPGWPDVIQDPPKARAQFDSMLDDIKMRGKQAVIVALPTGPVVSLGPTPDLEQLHAIAAHSCAAFIDGNGLFRNSLTPIQMAAYWPRYEGHWYKAGGDRFAELLAPELMRLHALHDVEPKAADACH